MAYKFSKGTFNFGGTLDLSGGDIDLPSGSVDTADIGHAQVDSEINILEHEPFICAIRIKVNSAIWRANQSERSAVDCV